MAYKRINELGKDGNIDGSELLILQGNSGTSEDAEAKNASVKDVFNAMSALITVESLEQLPETFVPADGKQIFNKADGLTYKCVYNVSEKRWDFQIKADAGNFFIANDLNDRDTSTSIVRKNGVCCTVLSNGVKYIYNEITKSWNNADKYFSLPTTSSFYSDTGHPDYPSTEKDVEFLREEITDGSLMYSEDEGIIYRVLINENTGERTLEATTIGGNVEPVLSYIYNDQIISTNNLPNGLTMIVPEGENGILKFNVKVYIGGQITLRVYRNNNLYQTSSIANGENEVNIGKISSTTEYKVTIIDAFNNECKVPLIFKIKPSDLRLSAKTEIRNDNVANTHGLKGMTNMSPFDFSYTLTNSLTDTVSIDATIDATEDSGETWEAIANRITINKSDYSPSNGTPQAYNTILTGIIDKCIELGKMTDLENGYYSFSNTGTYILNLIVSTSIILNEGEEPEEVSVHYSYQFTIAEAGKIYLYKTQDDTANQFNSISNVSLSYQVVCEGNSKSQYEYYKPCSAYNVEAGITHINDIPLETLGLSFDTILSTGVSTTLSDIITTVLSSSKLAELYKDEYYDDEGKLTFTTYVRVYRYLANKDNFTDENGIYHEEAYEARIDGVKVTITKYTTSRKPIVGYEIQGKNYSQTADDGNIIFDFDMNSPLRQYERLGDNKVYNPITVDEDGYTYINSTTDDNYRIKIMSLNDFSGERSEEYVYTDMSQINKDESGNESYQTYGLRGENALKYFRFTKKTYGILVDKYNRPANIIRDIFENLQLTKVGSKYYPANTDLLNESQKLTGFTFQFTLRGSYTGRKASSLISLIGRDLTAVGFDMSTNKITINSAYGKSISNPYYGSSKEFTDVAIVISPNRYLTIDQDKYDESFLYDKMQEFYYKPIIGIYINGVLCACAEISRYTYDEDEGVEYDGASSMNIGDYNNEALVIGGCFNGASEIKYSGYKETENNDPTDTSSNTQAEEVGIKNHEEVDLMNLKFYSRALSSDEILENYIVSYILDENYQNKEYQRNIFSKTTADKFTSIPKIVLAQQNPMYYDNGTWKPRQVHGKTAVSQFTDLLSMQFFGTEDDKANKAYCRLYYLNNKDKPDLATSYTELTDSQGRPYVLEVGIQGTSSIVNPTKNLKLTVADPDFVNFAPVGDGSNTSSIIKPGGNTEGLSSKIKKKKINVPEGLDSEASTWHKESVYTFKCDYVDSSNFSNTKIAEYSKKIMAEVGHKTPAQEKFPEENFQTAIHGFPFMLYIRDDIFRGSEDGTTYEYEPAQEKFMGIFMFNLDKECEENMGYNFKVNGEYAFPFAQSLEGETNTTASSSTFYTWNNSFYQYIEYEDGTTKVNNEVEYFFKDFSARYQYERDFSTADVIDGTNGTILAATEDGVKQEFDKNGIYSTDMDNPNFSQIAAAVDFVDNSSDKEFIANFENYFDKQAIIGYLLQALAFSLVDNLGKNIMFTTFGEHRNEDGSKVILTDPKYFATKEGAMSMPVRWIPQWYDLDTCFGISNTGVSDIEVYTEMREASWDKEFRYDLDNLKILFNEDNWKENDVLVLSQDELKTIQNNYRAAREYTLLSNEEAYIEGLKTLLTNPDSTYHTKVKENLQTILDNFNEIHEIHKESFPCAYRWRASSVVGGIDKQYDVSIDNSFKESGFNANTSRLWIRVFSLFNNEIVDAYKQMRQPGHVLNENVLYDYFERFIYSIPKSYYNKSVIAKYLKYKEQGTTSDGKTLYRDIENEFTIKNHGDRIHMIKKFISERLTFLDSYFGTNASLTSQQIQFRGNSIGVKNIEIETYSPSYVVISTDSAFNNKNRRFIGRIEPRIFNPNYEAANKNTWIAPVSNICNITGLANLNMTDLTISSSSELGKLYKLDLSNTQQATGITLPNTMKNLRELYLDNAILAQEGSTSELNLSSFERLEVFSAKQAQIGNVKLPSNSLLSDIYLNETKLMALNFDNLKALTDLSSIKYVEEVQEITITSCDMIKSIDISNKNVRKLTISGCKNLTSINVQGCTYLQTFNIEDCPNIRTIDASNVNKYDGNGTYGLKVMDFTKLYNLRELYLNKNTLVERLYLPLFNSEEITNNALSGISQRVYIDGIYTNKILPSNIDSIFTNLLKKNETSYDLKDNNFLFYYNNDPDSAYFGKPDIPRNSSGTINSYGIRFNDSTLKVLKYLTSVSTEELNDDIDGVSSTNNYLDMMIMNGIYEYYYSNTCSYRQGANSPINTMSKLAVIRNFDFKFRYTSSGLYLDYVFNGCTSLKAVYGYIGDNDHNLICSNMLRPSGGVSSEAAKALIRSITEKKAPDDSSSSNYLIGKLVLRIARATSLEYAFYYNHVTIDANFIKTILSKCTANLLTTIASAFSRNTYASDVFTSQLFTKGCSKLSNLNRAFAYGNGTPSTLNSDFLKGITKTNNIVLSYTFSNSSVIKYVYENTFSEYNITSFYCTFAYNSCFLGFINSSGRETGKLFIPSSSSKSKCTTLAGMFINDPIKIYDDITTDANGKTTITRGGLCRESYDDNGVTRTNVSWFKQFTNLRSVEAMFAYNTGIITDHNLYKSPKNTNFNCYIPQGIFSGNKSANYNFNARMAFINTRAKCMEVNENDEIIPSVDKGTEWDDSMKLLFPKLSELSLFKANDEVISSSDERNVYIYSIFAGSSISGFVSKKLFDGIKRSEITNLGGDYTETWSTTSNIFYNGTGASTGIAKPMVGFFENTNIMGYYEDFLEGFTGIKSISGLFAHLYWLNGENPVGKLNEACYNEDSFVFHYIKKSQDEDGNEIFVHSKNSISEDIFKDLISVTTADYVFANKSSSDSSNNLYKYRSRVSFLTSSNNITNIDTSKVKLYYDIEDIFPYMKGYIPEGLFRNCTKLTSVSYGFAFLGSMTGIDQDIENNLEPKKFPNNLFENCPSITNLKSLFSYDMYYQTPNTNISDKVNKNFFKNLSSLRNITEIFKSCYRMNYDLQDMFVNNLLLTDITEAFNMAFYLYREDIGHNYITIYNNSNYSTVCNGRDVTLPKELFNKCSSITNAKSVFAGSNRLFTNGIIPSIFTYRIYENINCNEWFNISSIVQGSYPRIYEIKINNNAAALSETSEGEKVTASSYVFKNTTTDEEGQTIPAFLQANKTVTLTTDTGKEFWGTPTNSNIDKNVLSIDFVPAVYGSTDTAEYTLFRRGTLNSSNKLITGMEIRYQPSSNKIELSYVKNNEIIIKRTLSELYSSEDEIYAHNYLSYKDNDGSNRYVLNLVISYNQDEDTGKTVNNLIIKCMNKTYYEENTSETPIFTTIFDSSIDGSDINYSDTTKVFNINSLEYFYYGSSIGANNSSYTGLFQEEGAFKHIGSNLKSIEGMYSYCFNLYGNFDNNIFDHSSNKASKITTAKGFMAAYRYQNLYVFSDNSTTVPTSAKTISGKTTGTVTHRFLQNCTALTDLRYIFSGANIRNAYSFLTHSGVGGKWLWTSKSSIKNNSIYLGSMFANVGNGLNASAGSFPLMYDLVTYLTNSKIADETDTYRAIFNGYNLADSKYSNIENYSKYKVLNNPNQFFNSNVASVVSYTYYA